MNEAPKILPEIPTIESDVYKNPAAFESLKDIVSNTPNQLVEDYLSNTAELDSVNDSVELESKSFFKKRWQQATNVLKSGKKIVNYLADRHLYVHQNQNNRYSLSDSLEIRLYRATFIPAILDIKNGTDYGMDHPRNNIVAAMALNRQSKRDVGEVSRSDWTKIVGYELLTVPVVRAMGLMAIYGVTKPLNEILQRNSPDSKTTKVVHAIHAFSGRRLVRHETGEYNPIQRKIKYRVKPLLSDHQLHSFVKK